MKIFCIPYAGGNEDVYNGWGNILNCEVIPIFLKGRKERVFMPGYNTLDEAVEDTYTQITMNKSLEEDYCVFGHSMGGLIAYEVYYKMVERKQKLPNILFISGVNVPGCKYSGKILSKCDNEEIIKILFPLGGISSEIMKNKQVLDFYMQILKNDMHLIEDYGTRKYDMGIESDLVIIYCDKDMLIDKNIINNWNKVAREKFHIYNLEGGHFYILNNTEKLLKIINSNLTEMEV